MTDRACACCGLRAWRVILNRPQRHYLECTTCGFQAQEYADGVDVEERFHEQQRQYYGEDAATLVTAHAFLDDEVLTTRLRVLEQHLQPGASVLEVGPGNGRVAHSLGQRGYSVTTVEESEVLGARLRREGLTVSTGAFETMDFASAQFDAFCSFHVIEHVPDVRKHLEKARLAVRTGGWAFVATPSADSWEHHMPAALSPNFDAAHLYLFSRQALARCLDRTGWQVVAVCTPEYATAWMRVVTKVVRRLRKEDEERTAGKYAGRHAGRMGNLAIAMFATLGRPWRSLQARVGRGNELFVVARAV